MKTKKLTKVQYEIFARMELKTWYSAYELGASMATLNALYHRNLLYRKSLTGSFSSPRTAVEFKRNRWEELTKKVQ